MVSLFQWRWTLLGRSEDSRRPDEQEEQQNRQCRDVLESRSEADDGERLEQAEQQAAKKGAEGPPEAADDRRDKALIANGTPTLKAVYCVGVIRMPAMAPSAALSAKASTSMRETVCPEAQPPPG